MDGRDLHPVTATPEMFREVPAAVLTVPPETGSNEPLPPVGRPDADEGGSAAAAGPPPVDPPDRGDPPGAGEFPEEPEPGDNEGDRATERRPDLGGAALSGADVRAAQRATRQDRAYVDDGVDVYRDGRLTVYVNTHHPQEVRRTDQALDALEAEAPLRWSALQPTYPEAQDQLAPVTTRRVVDSLETPSLVAKVTEYPADDTAEPDHRREMALNDATFEIVKSPAVMGLARQEGFSDVVVVEPYASSEMTRPDGTRVEVVVYPYQWGAVAGGFEEYGDSPDAPQDTLLARVQRVLHGVEEVAITSGFDTGHLSAGDALIGDDGVLYLTGMDHMSELPEAQHTLHHGECIKIRDGMWLNDWGNPEDEALYTVAEGAAAVVRRGEEPLDMSGALTTDTGRGAIITLSNLGSGEAAMVHAPRTQISMGMAEEMLVNPVIRKVPSLQGRATLAHIFTDGSLPAGELTDLRMELYSHGITHVTHRVLPAGTRVLMDSDSGQILAHELDAETGEIVGTPLYNHIPPEPEMGF